MLREEDWENRILALLEALPLGDDGKKRVPVVVLLKAVDAMPIRVNHRTIARILKAQHYKRTTFRTTAGVIAGYISPQLVSVGRGKPVARRGKRIVSAL